VRKQGDRRLQKSAERHEQPGDDIPTLQPKHATLHAHTDMQARRSQTVCQAGSSWSYLQHCLAFVLQLHLVHLVATNQLQHAEAVSILWTKLGAVLLL
jgi:hypothetical protein